MLAEGVPGRDAPEPDAEASPLAWDPTSTDVGSGAQTCGVHAGPWNERGAQARPRVPAPSQLPLLLEVVALPHSLPCLVHPACSQAFMLTAPPHPRVPKKKNPLAFTRGVVPLLTNDTT